MSALVSIVVPKADAADDGATRLANAETQVYPHCEVIAVTTRRDAIPAGAIHLPGAGLAEALNAAIAASRGSYISLLLPGARYSPQKVACQVAFMAQFELQNAVVFCNHALQGSRDLPETGVDLPSVDPSSVFRKLFGGYPLQLSTLLIPRQVLQGLGPLCGACAPAVSTDLLLRLCQQVPFVGMADRLVCVGPATMDGPSAREMRAVYRSVLPGLLRAQQHAEAHQNLFGDLGEAACARVSEGLPLAAWDVVAATVAQLRRSTRKPRALQAFLSPAVRTAFRCLPESVKRMTRGQVQRQVMPSHAKLDFPTIYRENGFVGTESLSGAGSTRFQTRIVRRELPLLFQRLGVKSLLDIPCGDFHWMREVDLAGIRYIGADVVDAMVNENQRRFSNPERQFECVDLISGPLPQADLVFCRDCLVHLPFADALAAINTVRNSRSHWFLTTTFTRSAPNRELDTDGWRPLNLTLAPFDLPAPELVILEKCTEAGGLAGDKALGLWRIADLQSPGSI